MGKIIDEKEFIQNFALELTNRTLKQREEIGKKYYKQLERLQAEYDDLHLNYAGCKTANKGLQELNDNLQAENERLKKEVETWNYQADKRAELSDIWFNTAETYKQALREIREIATLFHSVNENKDLDRFKNNILAKINSVIGAEE